MGDEQSYKPYVPPMEMSDEWLTPERVMSDKERLEAELERTRRVVTRLAKENDNLRLVLSRVIEADQLITYLNEI